MSSRGRKQRLKSYNPVTAVDSERRNSLRSSKGITMAAKPSSSDKGSFEEVKEMLKKQNEYMELQFKEVKENVRHTDEKISAINENVSSVQTQVGQLTEQQSVADEKIAILEAAIEQSDRIIEAMEEKLAKNQSSIEELYAKATVNDQAMKRLKYLKEFRKASLKKDGMSEQHQRKMNLWVYGLTENDKTEDTWARVRWFMIEALELNENGVDSMSIKNTHRVGDKKTTKGVRPVIIAFNKWTERQMTLRASQKLAQYNQKNETRLAVKTDLAPVARQKRKAYQVVSNKIRENNEGLARACDDGKGKVWLEMRPNTTVAWEKHDNPPEKYRHLVNNDPYGIPALDFRVNQNWGYSSLLSKFTSSSHN